MMNRNLYSHTRGRADAGFTLLEILVALAILLVGLTSVLVLFPESLSQATTANQKTIASQQAEATLGDIGQIGADALYHDQIPYAQLRQTLDEGAYAYTTTTQRIDDGSTGSNLQRVTLTISFPNGTTETYSTYVVNP
jgi:prepilin-type N-terminal cleavage/methylation domain-containing protein